MLFRSNLANRLLPARQDRFVARIGAMDRLNARLFDKSKAATKAPVVQGTPPSVPATPTANAPTPSPAAAPLPKPESGADTSEELPPAIATPVGPQADEEW